MNCIDRAYNFYKRHIYDEEKIRLLRLYNLKVAGSVPPVLWELFGALLTKRRGTGLTGADLMGWEVKSVRKGGSYEYQYHLNTGGQKLREDCEVNHLFCAYSETYRDVTVKAMSGASLAERYFKKWEPEYLKNYDSSIPPEQRRQRYRKNIPFGYIDKNGIPILQIEDGVLIFRDDTIIPKFNQR